MAKKIGGQVSIWIVIGVLIVGAVILTAYLLFERGSVTLTEDGGSALDIESFLQRCSEDSIKEKIEIMIPQGGFVEPRNYIVFDKRRVEYICKNVNYYEPCVQQHPAFLNDLKLELSRQITPEIDRCLDELKQEFEERRSEVSFEDGSAEITIDLGQDLVTVLIEKPTTVKRDEEVKYFNEFEFEVKSPMYNLASVAAEIANQEARYCYFEYAGYSYIYPRYEIRAYTTSDSSRVYSIKDVESNRTMFTAVRGCVIGRGLPIQ